MDEALLRLDGVRSFYGRIEAVKGVSIEVRSGEIVAIVGANGAGKTTLLRAISGVQPISAGAVKFAGERIERVPAHLRVGRGIAHSPEGRQVFGPLSVEDNLRLGGFRRRDDGVASDLDHVYGLFPILAEKRRLQAAGLSGGQQQMLAIGRAMMAKPRILLLDEPSMGLAPLLVDQILEVIVTLRREGTTILLVEQNAVAALGIADRGYVLETGRLTFEGQAADLLADPRIREAYLGI